MHVFLHKCYTQSDTNTCTHCTCNTISSWHRLSGNRRIRTQTVIQALNREFGAGVLVFVVHFGRFGHHLDDIWKPTQVKWHLETRWTFRDAFHREILMPTSASSPNGSLAWCWWYRPQKRSATGGHPVIWYSAFDVNSHLVSFLMYWSWSSSNTWTWNCRHTICPVTSAVRVFQKLPKYATSFTKHIYIHLWLVQLAISNRKRCYRS